MLSFGVFIILWDEYVCLQMCDVACNICKLFFVMCVFFSSFIISCVLLLKYFLRLFCAFLYNNKQFLGVGAPGALYCQYVKFSFFCVFVKFKRTYSQPKFFFCYFIFIEESKHTKKDKIWNREIITIIGIFKMYFCALKFESRSKFQYALTLHF